MTHASIWSVNCQKLTFKHTHTETWTRDACMRFSLKWKTIAINLLHYFYVFDCDCECEWIFRLNRFQQNISSGQEKMFACTKFTSHSTHVLLHWCIYHEVDELLFFVSIAVLQRSMYWFLSPKSARASAERNSGRKSYFSDFQSRSFVNGFQSANTRWSQQCCIQIKGHVSITAFTNAWMSPISF